MQSRSAIACNLTTRLISIVNSSAVISARRMTAEQDHLLGIHRFHDDPGDLSQLLLLVLR